jgi:DNA-binding NarL/FixJ family response regulator
MIAMTKTPHLTPRERQILRAVARGLGNRQIAQEFGISEQTIKNQMSTLFQKVGVSSRVQLAVYALKNDLA